MFSARIEAGGSCLHFPLLLSRSCNNTFSFEGCHPCPDGGLSTTSWPHSYRQYPPCHWWSTDGA